MLRGMIGKLIGAGLGLAVTSAAGAQDLPLPEYLSQVRTKHPGMQATGAAAESAERLLGESRLLTSPYAFAEGLKAYERNESLQPLMYGEARWQGQVTVGVEEQTLVGTRYRIFHQTMFTQIDGADINYIGLDRYYTARTGLELVQDIWRNAWGQQVRALSTLMEAKHQADLWERRYQMRQIEVEAEVAYGRLLLAQEMVRVETELLARAERLAAWVQERVALKLQDRSDLMQAQSQVEVRKLELAGAEDQTRMAAEAFNQLRGESGGTVSDILALPPLEGSVFSGLPEAPAVRMDVRAQEWTVRAASAQAARQQDDLQPEVQARAAIYLNGLDQEWSQAFADGRQVEHHGYMVGVNVRVPLDGLTRTEVERGYAREKDAAEYLLAQRKLEAESEWRALRRRLQAYQRRWEIAVGLEALQKQKADYERQRLRRGNSLMFQVLQFEQEWGQSQLARVQVETTVRELVARTKLFQEYQP